MNQVGPIQFAKKFLTVAWLIVTYSLVSLIARVRKQEEPERRLFLIRNTHKHCRRILKILGVEVEVQGDSHHRQYLIVANHLSYLDVIVIAASMPSVFVTSVEVSKTKFLGFMARCSGALFVERRSKSKLMEEVTSISETLRDGFNVVIFPEGTTGSGNQVLPFKMSLLDAAIRSRVDVLPLCLNYVTESRQKDSLFYYGDMEFFDHLKRLLKLRSVFIRLKRLSPILVSDKMTRKHLADKAYQSIKDSFIPVA